MENFLLGCNYWDSKSGTDMWKNWDEETVKSDLAALNKCGVSHLRVFPNWRDFQPIRTLHGWANNFKEYAFGENEEYMPPESNGIDPIMITRFRRFAKLASEFGMKLSVSILTGWMSGRMFTPPALEGKNLISDYEVRRWTDKYVKGIVSALKDIENIVIWDIGNECNCLEMVADRHLAYEWTAFVVNAIRAVDNTRPISSGMHGLNTESGAWRIEDQGYLCDILCTHPYPSPTIKGDVEPYNGMRTTMLPTAQSEFYSGIGKKPCMIQEQGVFSDTIGNREMAADFLRVNVLSAWANDLSGYLWWCGMDHQMLTQPPYAWGMNERELGLVDKELKAKPVGLQMKELSEALGKMPHKMPKDTDAVCILPKGEKYPRAASSYILAKQAGFNIRIENCDGIPSDSKAYILPAIEGWEVTFRRTYDYILDRVEKHGAKLLITYFGGHLTEFERVTGLTSLGMQKGSTHTAEFSFGKITYTPVRELILESVGAQILATNESGNIVFSKNKLGRGLVYFLNFSPEMVAFEQTNGFNPDLNDPYYMVYKEFAKDLIENYIVKSNDPQICITQSKNEDGTYIVTAINYSNTDRIFSPCIKEGWVLENIYGELDKPIGKCNGLVIKAKKK